MVEGLAWLVPVNERTERPVFASSALVLAGLGFLLHGCFPRLLRRRGREPAPAQSPSPR